MTNQNSNLQNLQPIKTLRFKDTALDVFEIENEQYMTSKAIAQALGYSRIDHINKLFKENQNEFSERNAESSFLSGPDKSSLSEKTANQTTPKTGVVSEPAMTRIVYLKTKTNVSYKLRLFNKRGAYLIAMLSKTKNAADFRKWVLDVLEGKETIEKSSAVGHKPLVIEDFKVGEALKVEGETERQKIRRMMLANCLKLKIFRHNCQSFKEELYKISSSLTSILILIDNFQEHTDIMEKDLDEVWKQL